MDVEKNLTALQEMARYRTAKKLLRTDAFWAAFWGVIALLLGVSGLNVTLLNLVLVIIGLFLISASIAAYKAPGTGAVVLMGTGLILIGLWNIGLTLLEILAGEKPGAVLGILGVFQIIWGVKMMGPRSRRAAISLAVPPSEAMQELEAVANGLRGKSEKDGPEYVEIVRSDTQPMHLKGRLTPDVAFFVDKSDLHIFLAQRGDFEITLKKEGPPQAKNKAIVRMRDEKFPCVVSQFSYERLVAWKSTAGAPGGPTASQ